MSVRAVSWAIDQAPVGGNTTARMILVSLADKADEYGRDAYKYVSAIADSIRKSDSTVSRNLAWMEEIGVIERGNQHLVDSYPEYARPIVYDLRLDLVQEPTERQTKKGRPGRPRKTVKDPKPATEHTPSQQEDNTRRKDDDVPKANDSNENKTLTQNRTGFFPRETTAGNPVAPVHPPRSHQCTHPGRTGALHNVLKHPKTNNPTVPTGHLPTEETDRADGGREDEPRADAAVTVLDRLALMRSKLGLSTPATTKTDLRDTGRLIARVTEANGGDTAKSLPLVLAVIDWMPANTFWLRRILTGRDLNGNWVKIANDYAVDRIEETRRHDEEALDRGRPAATKPAHVPDRHVSRHVHTAFCEHVLADMRPHEGEYDHEGSLRAGNPSEWWIACDRHADELNRRDGIEEAARETSMQRDATRPTERAKP